MRIAQIAPLYETTPPRLYGGTERVVAYLTDSMVQLRHDVTPFANWLGTVYHGLPLDLFRYSPAHDGYLAFVGRISPEKRPDRAIAIARRTGRTLRMAAKIDAIDVAYFHREIEPLMTTPPVEF